MTAAMGNAAASLLAAMMVLITSESTRSDQAVSGECLIVVKDRTVKDGNAEGYWNGQDKDSHAHYPLGSPGRWVLGQHGHAGLCLAARHEAALE